MKISNIKKKNNKGFTLVELVVVIAGFLHWLVFQYQIF